MSLTAYTPTATTPRRYAYTLTKGIPLAPRVGAPRAPARRRSPWQRAEVGDSFLFPVGMPVRKARALAFSNGKRLGKKFATRSTPLGVRCWRVA